MSLSFPLHANSRRVSEDELVLHRQRMAGYARVMNDNGDLAGFRPQYMEFVLVAAGHANPGLTDKPRSKRSQKRAELKRAYLVKARRNPSRARKH